MKLFFTPKGHYLDLTHKLIKKIDKEYQLYEHEKKEFDNLPKEEQSENKHLNPNLNELKKEYSDILKFELKLIKDKSTFIKSLVWILLVLIIAVVCSHFAFNETKFEPVNRFVVYFSGTMAILFFIFSYLFPEKANSYYKNYINLLMDSNLINDNIGKRENLIKTLKKIRDDVFIKGPKKVNPNNYYYTALQKILIYQILKKSGKFPKLLNTASHANFAFNLTGCSKHKYAELMKFELYSSSKEIREKYEMDKSGKGKNKKEDAIKNIISNIEIIKNEFNLIGFHSADDDINNYIDIYNQVL